MPVENLSGDANLDWVSRATIGVLGAELTGSKNVQMFEVPSAQDAATARANTLLQAQYQTDKKGNLHINGVIRDLSTNKTVRTIDVSGAFASGVLPVLNTLARRITPDPRPFGTSNEMAFQEYFKALSSRSPEEMVGHLQIAMLWDPKFAAPYMAAVEVMTARGDVAGAKSAIERAHAAASQFTPLDRARLQLFEALLNNDTDGRTRATAELARLQPADVEIRKNLSELYLVQKNFPASAQALEEASKLTPNDAGIWNALGYAYGYSGDLKNAMRAFDQYKKLAPNDANAIDSAGEVQFYAGNFAEAEQNFLAAHAKNAAQFNGVELYRAALSRLLMGDTAKADELFNRYATYRKQDPYLPIQTAVWKYETGKAPDAFAIAQQTLSSTKSPDVTSVIHSQVALWMLGAGDRENARGAAQAAMSAAASPQTKNLAIAASFLCLPSAPVGEWNARALRMAPNPAQARARQQLLAAALVFDRKYPDAIKEWRELYDNSSPAGSADAPVFLAWSYLQVGQKAEAEKLIRAGIIPPRSPDPGLDSLAIARYVLLRKQFEKK